MVNPTYLRIWQFRPNPQKVSEFVDVYGPNGEWAKLFRRAEGYIETELVQSATDPSIYVTIDRWRDGESWEAFKSAYGEAYAELDWQCESLTIEEREVGNFKTT
ncbi:MAG: antibiotic biosynthesis monooxygenase [Bacteroidetes bacterium]|nr:antibiotic biosynthesis monooxygenase [Bacteroidota bacterium]MCW5894243.1 antibiotic biosynthesis monooxygenase [Bacteroidota bacterium]